MNDLALAKNEAGMTPAQLFLLGDKLGPVGQARLAYFKEHGVLPTGPSESSKEEKKEAATKEDFAVKLAMHKNLALSVPYEIKDPYDVNSYNWSDPIAKKPAKAVYDADGKLAYFDDGYSCMAPFKTAAAQTDSGVKVSTPDVRKKPGELSFAQTPAMDTAAYYAVHQMPPTIQVDFSKLPGGQAPFANPITTGPSFAGQAAPMDIMAPSPSAAFAPMGGLEAKPITFFNGPAAPTHNVPVSNPGANVKKPTAEAPLKLIDAQNDFRFSLEA